jgi:anti-sigma B factor antagonist
MTSHTFLAYAIRKTVLKSGAMPSEPLTIERLIRATGGEGVLRLTGPLTMDNLPDFQNAVRRERAPTMILDLSGVPYIDSAGLGSLIAAYTSGHKNGQRWVLTGVNERIMKVMQITHVEHLFLMFPSVWTAMEALTNSGRA